MKFDYNEEFTLHDTITFAIRDNMSPRVWADADEIADVVIRAVAHYRRMVSEGDFLDSLRGPSWWPNGSTEALGLDP